MKLTNQQRADIAAAVRGLTPEGAFAEMLRLRGERDGALARAERAEAKAARETRRARARGQQRRLAPDEAKKRRHRKNERRRARYASDSEYRERCKARGRNPKTTSGAVSPGGRKDGRI